MVNANNQIADSVWLDLNTKADFDGNPDLLPDVMAISNSLWNLFRCPIGSRGPIFQPEYGTYILQLVHEPLDEITANKIRIFVIQAIQRWEPRIHIDMSRTTVVPDSKIPAFRARIYYTLVGLGVNANTNLIFPKF